MSYGFGFFLEVIEVFLLVATIIYAIRLNQRLNVLYKNKQDLQIFMEQFSLSLGNVEKQMLMIKSTSGELFAEIDNHKRQTQAIKDDLALLVERGDSVAERLQEAISKSRPLMKSLEQVKGEGHEETKPSEEEGDEPAILKALRRVR